MGTTMKATTASIQSWTVLSDRSDRIRAVISPEGHGFAVRDERGRVLGRYRTIKEALEALPGEREPADR